MHPQLWHIHESDYSCCSAYIQIPRRHGYSAYEFPVRYYLAMNGILEIPPLSFSWCTKGTQYEWYHLNRSMREKEWQTYKSEDHFLNVKVNVKSKLILFICLIHVPGLIGRVHTTAKYGCHSYSECSISFWTWMDGWMDAVEIPI